MRISSIISIIKANFKIWYLKILNKENEILPYKILINLTDLCNSRCVFCEIWKIKPENEINLNQIKDLLKSINSQLLLNK